LLGTLDGVAAGAGLARVGRVPAGRFGAAEATGSAGAATADGGAGGGAGGGSVSADGGAGGATALLSAVVA
jgi:hypothetical protein